MNKKPNKKHAKIIVLIITTVILCILFLANCKEITVQGQQSGMIRIWIFGLLISMGLGNIITNITMKYLKDQIPDDEPGKFAFLLGTLEALTYTVAWAKGYPSFIPIWLGIKMAGRWNTAGEKNKDGEINSFLIGNLLTVIFSIIAGQTIKLIIANGWNLNITI